MFGRRQQTLHVLLLRLEVRFGVRHVRFRSGQVEGGIRGERLVQRISRVAQVKLGLGYVLLQVRQRLFVEDGQRLTLDDGVSLSDQNAPDRSLHTEAQRFAVWIGEAAAYGHLVDQVAGCNGVELLVFSQRVGTVVVCPGSELVDSEGAHDPQHPHRDDDPHLPRPQVAYCLQQCHVLPRMSLCGLPHETAAASIHCTVI